MLERKGNYIEGTTMQMDYEYVLKMVQVAYMDKKYEMQRLLERSWSTDRYEMDRYHQHTRGHNIARLGREFERIAVILHHLQALGVSKERQDTFTWWFYKGDEEE